MTVLLERAAPSRTASPARVRDPFLDVLRVLGMAAVVFQHWTIPVLSFDGSRLTTGNALSTPGVWVVTWLSQVMPLVFFAGGAANAISFGRAGHDGPQWLVVRLRRLAWPLLPLAAVWLPLPHLLLMLGGPAQPLEVGAGLTGQLLWFLVVYLIAVAATPYMLRLHAGHGLRVPVALAAGAALTDVVRFSAGFEALGYLWLAGWPIWLTLLGLTMWPLLKGFARFEEPPALPYGKATWSSALAATGLVACGLLALTVAGFAPGLTPVLAILAIFGGLLVTGPRAQL